MDFDYLLGLLGLEFPVDQVPDHDRVDVVSCSSEPLLDSRFDGPTDGLPLSLFANLTISALNLSENLGHGCSSYVRFGVKLLEEIAYWAGRFPAWISANTAFASSRLPWSMSHRTRWTPS